MAVSTETSLIASAVKFFGNESYRVVGDGIAQKRRLMLLLFKLVSLLSRTRLGNALLISGAVLGYTPFRRPHDAPLFQFGWSRNNVRVLRRTNAAASRSDWDALINGMPLTFSSRLAVLVHLGPLWRMAGELTRSRASNPFVQTQLILAGAARLVFAREDFRGVQCICFASDHSPLVMGLLDVARERGLSTCYVQHAPVADYFPPLDYDLSILFDRASIATYQRAADRRQTSSKGKVVILPPFKTEAVQPALTGQSYRIGICLSYLFDAKNLSDLIGQLIDHPAVASVQLRAHPRCRADLSEFTRHRKVSNPACVNLSEFADISDIALVPNSGVAVELLHIGKPVLYTPGMDFIGYDYYGFVKDGVVPVFKLEFLDNPARIDQFFGSAWRQRFAKFDETIETPLEESRTLAGEAFRALVEGVHSE